MNTHTQVDVTVVHNHNNSDVSVGPWSTLTWWSEWSRRTLPRAEESSPRCPLCWLHSRSPPETAPSQRFHQCRPARGHTAQWGIALQVFAVYYKNPHCTCLKTEARLHTSVSPWSSYSYSQEGLWPPLVCCERQNSGHFQNLGKSTKALAAETMTTVSTCYNDVLLSGLLKALKYFPKQSFCGVSE